MLVDRWPACRPSSTRSATRSPARSAAASPALEGGGCLAGALGSVRSAVFRSRGVAASYSARPRPHAARASASATTAASSSPRRAPCSPPLDGVVDENVLARRLSRRASSTQRSSLTSNAYANWFESELDRRGDAHRLQRLARLPPRPDPRAQRHRRGRPRRDQPRRTCRRFHVRLGPARPALPLLTGPRRRYDVRRFLRPDRTALPADARPAFYFESVTHRKALAYLGYGLAQGEGFIVITGEVGAGKSTLVAHLMATIDPRG